MSVGEPIDDRRLVKIQIVRGSYHSALTGKYDFATVRLNSSVRLGLPTNLHTIQLTSNDRKAFHTRRGDKA